MSFKCKNCGKCCGPIPVTLRELWHIKATLLSRDKSELIRVRNQVRPELTCPLRDIENKSCLVYEARPFPCRQYGFISKMICPNNKRVAFKSNYLANKESAAYLEEDSGGILGGTIKWDNLLPLED